MPTEKQIIAIGAPATMIAAEDGGNGPVKFTAEFYTGGAMNIVGWDLPVVIDLAGLAHGNSLVANLDHDRTKRVGNFAVANDGKSLVANGSATAATAARDEVVNSAAAGFQWQASLEVEPAKGGVEELKAGKTITVNGQQITGPAYVTRKGTLKGFAFVSHGADDNTAVSIAAGAANGEKMKTLDPKIAAWIKSVVPSVDTDSLTDEQIAGFTADYEGQQRAPAASSKSTAIVDPFEARRVEATRIRDINAVADRKCEDYQNAGLVDQIDEIRQLAAHAIETKMSPQEFRLELYECGIPNARPVSARTRGLTNRVLEAAICQAGLLADVEKRFSDQELQVAHDHFRGGIGLNQFLILAAEQNGYRGMSNGGRVNQEIQNAAFGCYSPYRNIHAGGGGFSTIDVASIVAATANKFLHEGWMAIDMTPLRIASVRPVRNFQQVTTVSLTGHLQFEKIGADGELKHGTLDDLNYTNQADTYGTMLSITRKDIINDDLGALTAAPKRLGRGGALKLNDIFWTEFLGLVSANFFAAGNNNINTAVADMTIGGLAATETIFMNQTDPDGKPLGIMPKIVLVPTALKAAATALLDSQNGSVLITGASTTIPAANVFQGRFRVESSPYISNSSYTGNTSAGWWMLADPNECPVIEIAALNGRVEPIVETVAAPQNVLGVVMRGYSDIGVNEQEKRGGVYADGGSS